MYMGNMFKKMRIHNPQTYSALWVGCSQATFVSFITLKVYTIEDSNLLYWKEELLIKPLMKKLFFTTYRKTAR